jgi:1,4-alpha-glucan branching enzyme
MPHHPLSLEDAKALSAAEHHDPFSLLGIHADDRACFIRTVRPEAVSARIIPLEGKPRIPLTMRRIDGTCVFEAEAPAGFPRNYRVEYTFESGAQRTEEDPYRFGRMLSEFDAHLFREGQLWALHHHFGAQIREIDGVPGTAFTVWAPNAQRVSVVGDFNDWDGRRHVMRMLWDCGVWEIFVPEVTQGAHYKFEIRTRDGVTLLKSDPLAFFSQNGIQNASLVARRNQFTWSDSNWMEFRRSAKWHQRPVTVYEVHVGSWRRNPDGSHLTYRQLAEQLLPYVAELGFTHVELLPIAEHPFEGSWGYQITGFFAPTSRFGNPDDFRYFVDTAHRLGIGVILDWVPGHFPKDANGLIRFDGTHLYEHADPRQGEHVDWGTLIFNYGRNEVRNFLIANALYWIEEFHIDALRVDAVASMLYLDYSRKPGEWVPNRHGGRENLDAIYFLKRFNEIVFERFPDVMTIAEESTAWPAVSRPTYSGGLGFSFKWNMGWMHDSLSYMSRNPSHRRYHQNEITFSIVYAFHENFMLVLSHDEVVHGKRALIEKMPGDEWQKFANIRMFYAWMFAHPGKKLLFMGAEFGQKTEWNHDRSLDWACLTYPLHAALKNLIADLNHLIRSEPSFHEKDDSADGFRWIDFHDEAQCVISFERLSDEGERCIVIVNATPLPRYGYRVGLPEPGFYKEIINTDSATYGGSNLGNFGGTAAETVPCHGHSWSAAIDLPPLATLIFKHVAGTPTDVA